MCKYFAVVKCIDQLRPHGAFTTRYPRWSDDPNTSMTHRMVRDLVNGPLDGGRGIMILIRQPGDTGRVIFDKIHEARDACGLQGRFAVLIDPDEGRNGGSEEARLCSVMKKYNRVKYEQMKTVNGGNDPVITQYSHQEGVNCILILCEKGKMGT